MKNQSDRRRKLCMRSFAVLLAALLVLSSCSSREYESYQLGTGSGFESGGSGASGGGTGGTGGGESETKENEEDSDEEMPSIFGRVTKKKNPDEGGGTGSGSGSEEGGSGSGTGTGDDYEDIFVINEGPNTAYQLTEEDIQNMNGGKALIV